jgi:hypothetical protein
MRLGSEMEAMNPRIAALLVLIAVPSRGSHDILLTDIGGDGDLDIVGANWSGDFQPVELWENRSRTSGGN